MVFRRVGVLASGGIGTELTAARLRLSAGWQARLADLLEDDPRAAA
jgi:hypothetical protein